MSGDRGSLVEGVLSSLRGGGERKRIKGLIEELQEIPASERVDVPYPRNVGVVSTAMLSSHADHIEAG